MKNNRRSKLLFGIIMTAFIVAGVSFATTYVPKDWVLPNKAITPGVLNKDVNQNNIKDNICKVGWTKTIRPTVTYTNKLKLEQLKGDYKYFTSVFGTEPSKYEEDHLISLQLGGHPSDPKNLFPQPYAGNNARKKDVLETKLKKMVCAGTLKLADAQKMIATDWAGAYKKYALKETEGNSEDN